MWKKIALPVLGLIAVGAIILAVAISMQPDEYTVTRSTPINAEPDTIFEQVNDFKKWDAWSPWAKLDPNMKVTHSGSPSGKGASYAWVGNSDVGEGRMTITESHPASHVKIDLEFLKPFEARNVTEFLLKPEAGKTNVTWNMNGKHNVLSKAMCLVVSMDQMMGPDFEKGLAQLKTVAEGGNIGSNASSSNNSSSNGQSVISAFHEKIQSLDPQGTIISGVRQGDSEKWAVIEVSGQWHNTPKGARLELAKAFQKAWASYLKSENALIEIKDRSGNKIGGSTFMGDVYVD